MNHDLPPPGLVEITRSTIREMKIRLLFDKSHPLGFGFAAAITVWISGLSPEKGTCIVDDVLAVAVSAAAILAGFQATAQSVLLSMIGSPAVKYLQSIDRFELVVKYHWSSIWSLMLFVAVSITVLVFRALTPDESSLPSWILILLTFLIVWAGLASVRITRLMFRLMLRMNREK